ncbi:permease [Anaerobranca gottschalkii]|uniref:Permease n=1 Tax=Anaerobranca gottschalkii DSM 13577 TaxID=1120990 RepID=A0A1H9ZXA2_9FIRM|nr:permease [Anaerobranca gottschalkii]SES86391.1 hypothetical protein SAMN03080614_101429 [Anaerobranca gottschalkii DSM 13577]
MAGERKKLLLIISVFLIAYFIPVDSPRVQGAIIEAVYMVNDYAREHVLLCLIPAFFIAGGLSIFISQGAVLKYFGAKANKILSYTVASLSGTILAVCSCTILPLFAGIYKRGAGIGPATAFLYSGPAINVMAIIVTARVLGVEMGIARAISAVFFSIIIGLIMHFIYRNEQKEEGDLFIPEDEETRPLWKNALYFGTMVGILVFANWGRPIDDNGIWASIFNYKWILTGFLSLLLAYILINWFDKGELKAWTESTWDFAKQILPLLFGGVIIAGLLLGRPGYEGLIPSHWVETLVGGNSLGANFFTSLAGAFMYFATLTEVPILEGLIGAGMGKGPALALLLAGPALSLPNMLVIRSVMGTKKTIVFVSLVIIMATIAGLIFGTFFNI